MDKAPDFNKGYPSGGAVIGPAWQAAWEYLAKQGKPVSGATIAKHVQEVLAEQGIDVNANTVKATLHKAARNGLLTKGTATIRSRTHTTFKRIPGVDR